MIENLREAHASVTIVVTVLLSACNTLETAPPQEILSSRDVSEKNYALGDELVVSVGEEIIRVREFRLDTVARNEVEVLNDFTIGAYLFEHDFVRGERYVYEGTVEYEGIEYHILHYGFAGYLFDEQGRVFNKILNFEGPIPVFILGTFDPLPPGAHLRRTVEETPDINFPYLNFRIIFVGLTDDSMRFRYEEYTPNDLQDYTISQDFVYPLGTREVRFRDYVVEVLDATETEIRYIVISD